MKIRRYFLYVLCVILYICNIIVILSNRYIIVNDKVDLNIFLSSKDYSVNPVYSDMLFTDGRSQLIVNKDIKYENDIINFSKEMVDKLFDTSFSASRFISTYYMRKPHSIFNTNVVSGLDYGTMYSYYYDYIYQLKERINADKNTYAGIKDIKVRYILGGNYVVSIYLNDYYFGGTLYDNMVIDFQVFFEKSSNKIKILDLLLYDSDEVYNTFSSKSVSRLYNNIPLDDSDAEKDILNFKKSMVIIEAYDDGKLVDKVNGFFVGDNVIATTYDIFEQQHDYIVKSDSDNYNIYKIVAFSKLYNLCLIKIEESIDYQISNSNYVFIPIGKKLFVPNFDNYYYVGTGLRSFAVDSDLIRTNIKLSKNDRGTPLLDSNNTFIGINTIINEEFNYSYAVDSLLIYELLYCENADLD